MALPFPNIRPELLGPFGPIKVGGLSLGPFAVRWYAMAYVAGIAIGWWYAVRMVVTQRLWGRQTPTMTRDQVDDLAVWAMIGVILGGRIGYILFYIFPRAPERTYLFDHPFEAFAVWHGGMSFHGGMLGVLAAMAYFAWKYRLDLFRVADVVVCVQPIGQFFGRVANFINGELYGRTTSAPWGMVFCNDTIRAASGGGCPAGYEPRHPSQLYEAALEGVALFLILRLCSHRFGWLQKRGALSGVFLVGYGAFRILLENVRMPDEGLQNLPFGLTVGIILSVPMVLAGAWLLWRGLKTPTPVEAHEPA